MRGHRASFRRTRYGAGLLVVALVGTWLVTADVGATANDPGQGNSAAQIISVNPRAGSLSVGVTLGEALAGHQNESSKAQSLWADLGVIGTSLTTASCGSPPTFQPNQLPQPLIVEPTDPNAGSGVTQRQDGGVATQFGQAKSTPYAKAITTIAPISIPGLLSIAGGTATSWSGIVDGHREAGSTVDIAGIDILGKVSLVGLHWDVRDQSTGTPSHTGSFSVAGITIGGTKIPTVDVVSALQQVNAVLGLLGLQFHAPAVHQTQGTEYVDPLQISIVPNATRDLLLGTVLQAIQPIRQPTFAAILAAVCKASTPIEVADITIGAISGAGSFDLDLGGLHATSGEVAANGFNLGIPGPGGLPLLSNSPALDTTGQDSAASSYTPTGVTPPVTFPGTAADGTKTPSLSPQAIEPIKALHGSRGGALAAIGLGGLALLALLAEGDRRMMRRAQRKTSLED